MAALIQRPSTSHSPGARRSCPPSTSWFHDGTRALELFDFDYTLEMYKPKAKRRWGYFALPVLHHDRLVGEVDAVAKPKTATLQVQAIHQDVPFNRELEAVVDAELAALAARLRLTTDVRGSITARTAPA